MGLDCFTNSYRGEEFCTPVPSCTCTQVAFYPSCPGQLTCTCRAAAIPSILRVARRLLSHRRSRTSMLRSSRHIVHSDDDRPLPALSRICPLIIFRFGRVLCIASGSLRAPPVLIEFFKGENILTASLSAYTIRTDVRNSNSKSLVRLRIPLMLMSHNKTCCDVDRIQNKHKYDRGRRCWVP